MPSRVLVLDTSVLCCLLQVPGKETAGPADDQWTHERIRDLLIAEESLRSTFVLPIASLIETGNHVANCNGDRFGLASALGAWLRASATSESPWATFSDQHELWDEVALLQLCESWPPLAAGGFSIGDATIKAVAEFYASAGCHVQILTGDQGLRAYEPEVPPVEPRRRRGRP